MNLEPIYIQNAVAELSDKFSFRLRVRYNRLPDESKTRLENGYARHAAACKKCDVDPDPRWVIEAIEELGDRW